MDQNSQIKRLAVIVSGIDEEYQNTILQGIHDYAKKENVDVMHFVAFGGTLRSERHDVGEYNIFELCQFDQFDGVILLTNTISDSLVTANIVKRLSASKVPAVCIDNDLDTKFYHIGIDNFDAMSQIVRHIVEDHHCTRIAYISGPENNPESIQRYQAFESVMRENHLTIDPDFVYNGSFRSCDGRDGVNYFLNNGKPLPEAIICANDVMALATILELNERGIQVPDDILVTGFDDIYAGRNFAPSITSVARPLYQSGYLACEAVLESKPRPHSTILETKVVKRQSCGCDQHLEDQSYMDDQTFRKETYRTVENYQVSIPAITRMSTILAESDNFQECMESLKGFVQEFGCDRFYLCLGSDWNTQSLTQAPGGQQIRFLDQYTSKGYTEMMQVPLAYLNGQFTTLPDFMSKQMLPDVEIAHLESSFYYFLPLHVRDRNFGYCVLCGTEFETDNPLLHTWAMNISNSLENIRKMEYLDKALAEVNALYICDSLCKINNRNGFNKFALKAFEECKKDRRSCMVMFIDMDHLKKINDTYSHEEGDNAIRQVARAIKISCYGDEVPARFGGDEFVIFATDYTEGMAQALATRIRNAMTEYNKVSAKPYEIDASIGWYISVVTDDDTISQLITAADQKMYEEKNRKHANRED